MRIFISVISHGHEDLIRKLGCLSELAKHLDLTIVLKDNISSSDLSEFSKSNGIHLIDSNHGLGFGENNNYIFNWCIRNLQLGDDDYFLILNPDVYVGYSDVLKIVELAEEKNAQLATINLFKDEKFEVFDECIRSFPSILDFVSSYTGFGNKTVLNKAKVTEAVEVDWAAGSFLLFKASLYRKLGGFDPNYFMYCEDIDICWRAQKTFGEKLIFFPQIKAIHHAQHANRSLFSKHFIWHVKSMVRYLLLFYGLRKSFKKNNNENRL